MRIIVEVKTGVKTESVEKIGDNRYRVRVKAPPRKGKANRAVLKLLKEYFKRPVNLVEGYASSIKVLDVIE
jgi:uncharacterized protein (TIGR00251 family)